MQFLVFYDHDEHHTDNNAHFHWRPPGDDQFN